MLKNNSHPMLGTLTPDRWGDRFRSYDRPSNAAFLRSQVRGARQAELRLIAQDIAGELEPDETVEWTFDAEVEADHYLAWALDDDEWLIEHYENAVEALTDDEFGTFAQGVTRMGDDRYALDDDDLPGWGSARIAYEDFSTGFRVTDRP